MLSQKAEEILETLWVTTQEETKDSMYLKERNHSPDDPEIRELLRLGFVKFQEEGLVLQGEGVKEAESVVRRHRLAERLMEDVLDIRGDVLEENACRFEHLLREEVGGDVWTLFGD